MPDGWTEANEGDAFVVSFDGVDRERRDAREMADFQHASHQGAARGFSMGGGNVGGPSGYQVVSPRARTVGLVVLCALLSPVVLAQCESRGGRWQASSAPLQWSNAQWLAHLGLTFVVLFACASVLAWIGTRRRRGAISPTQPAPALAPTDGRFTLRMTPATFALAGPPGTTAVDPIALERIAGFKGDQRLRVRLSNGAVTTLPCALPGHADHAPLAALLDRKLADVRAMREGYRGSR